MSNWDAPLELIDKGRWTQGALSDGSRFCALGLIGAALWGEGWMEDRHYIDHEGYVSLKRSSRGRKMVAALNEVIKEQFPERVWDQWYERDPITAVIMFNDDKETTEEDLRVVFEKASLK